MHNGSIRILVMVAMYSRLDLSLLEISYGIHYMCTPHSEQGLHIVDYSTITSVVAIVSHSGCFFVVEKIGLGAEYLYRNEDDGEV